MSNKAKSGCFGKLISYTIYASIIAFSAYFVYFYVTNHDQIVTELQKKEAPFKLIIAKAQKIFAESISSSEKFSDARNKAIPTVKGKLLILSHKPDQDGLSFDEIYEDVSAGRIASVPSDVHSVVVTYWYTVEYIKYTRGMTYDSKCNFALIDLDQGKVVYKGSLTGDHPSPPESMTGKPPTQDLIKIIDSLQIID